jgi:hypothetical protein
MKEISDKELDGFFKSSFEDFEVEPSANSWDNITQKLDQKPAKKKFPIYWAAAASVAIVFGIGINLYQRPGEIIKLRPARGERVASVTKVRILDKKEEASTEADLPMENTSSIKVNHMQSNTAQLVPKSDHKEVFASNNNNPEKNIFTDATKALQNNVLNAERVTNKTQELAQTKPIKVRSVTEQILADEALKNSKSMEILPGKVLTAQLKTDGYLEGDGTNPNRKSKIKSVGDLVNFVVAKVDKREEKIIKMSKTEESDNEITGINLGLFRFKKAE